MCVENSQNSCQKKYQTKTAQGGTTKDCSMKAKSGFLNHVSGQFFMEPKHGRQVRE
jgi:hypothetical protein